MGTYFDINRAMFYARQRFFNHLLFIQMQIKLVALTLCASLVAVGFATPILPLGQAFGLNRLSPEQRAALIRAAQKLKGN